MSPVCLRWHQEDVGHHASSPLCPTNLPVFSSPFWIPPSSIHPHQTIVSMAAYDTHAQMCTLSLRMTSLFCRECIYCFYGKGFDFLCLCMCVHCSLHQHSMEADTLWLWFLEMESDQSWLTTCVNYSGENSRTQSVWMKSVTSSHSAVTKWLGSIILKWSPSVFQYQVLLRASGLWGCQCGLIYGVRRWHQ